MNLPNKLSLLRIFLVPVMLFFYLATFIPFGKIIALIIFVLAAFTDMLDGKIARKYNLITEVGKLLDTIADKLLVTAGLLLVVVDGTIPHPYGIIVAIIIIGRELLISVFRQIAASKNFVMAADMFGKVKACTQFAGIPILFLVSYLTYNVTIDATILLVCQIISYVVIGVATILTILSGAHYIIKNKDVLKG